MGIRGGNAGNQGGMMGIRVGMRRIRVEIMGIRVGMRGMRGTGGRHESNKNAFLCTGVELMNYS